jgi:hypothetical protein
MVMKTFLIDEYRDVKHIYLIENHFRVEITRIKMNAI